MFDTAALASTFVANGALVAGVLLVTRLTSAFPKSADLVLVVALLEGPVYVDNAAFNTSSAFDELALACIILFLLTGIEPSDSSSWTRIC